MKKRSLAVLMLLVSGMLWPGDEAAAVTRAEDIATTIMLRGYDCGGREVTDIRESEDANGNRTIEATCPNGKRYRIEVSSDGRLTVTPIR